MLVFVPDAKQLITYSHPVVSKSITRSDWEISGNFDIRSFKLRIEAILLVWLLYWPSRTLKTKTRGQACGWQQTHDTRYVAEVSRATQIPRAALFVSTLMDVEGRPSFYGSWNPAQGIRGSHRAVYCRIPEWTLQIFWSVLHPQIRNC